MPDREIVIKELEALQKAMSDNQCYSCTHEFVDVVNLFGSNIVADALALLKEQDAVAIIWKFGFPHCPVCGQMLPEGDAVKYCLHCGRSVKWE